jgi:hypothetical protein
VSIHRGNPRVRRRPLTADGGGPYRAECGGERRRTMADWSSGSVAAVIVLFLVVASMAARRGSRNRTARIPRSWRLAARAGWNARAKKGG